MRLLVFVLTLILGGCAGAHRSEVTTFHNLSGSQVGKTFIMVPYKEQGDLEWKSYADQVAAQLTRYGLAQSVDGSTPDYAVFLRYAHTSSTHTGAVPMYGQTGGGTTSTTYGSVSRTPVYANTYTPPTYGITGFVPYEETVFSHGLRIDMYDGHEALERHRAVEVYQRVVINNADVANTNAVMPRLINAAFVDWPGPSGVTVRR